MPDLTKTLAGKNFWIVRRGREYLGVVRRIQTEQGDLYLPWFEATQIGEPQGSLEDAVKALDV